MSYEEIIPCLLDNKVYSALTLVSGILGIALIPKKVKEFISSYFKGNNFPEYGSYGKNLLFKDISEISLSENKKFSFSAHIFRDKNVKIKLSADQNVDWWIKPLGTSWLIGEYLDKDKSRVFSTNQNGVYDIEFIPSGSGKICIEIYDSNTSKLIRKNEILINK